MHVDIQCCIWLYVLESLLKVHQFFCILHFCHNHSFCLIVVADSNITLPSSTWSVDVVAVILPIKFRRLRECSIMRMADAACQEDDAVTSWIPCITSGFLWSLNVNHYAIIFQQGTWAVYQFIFLFFPSSTSFCVSNLLSSSNCQFLVGLIMKYYRCLEKWGSSRYNAVPNEFLQLLEYTQESLIYVRKL